MLLPRHRNWARPGSEGSVHYHPYRYSPISTWTPWGFSEALEGGSSIRKPLYALAPVVTAAALRKARELLRANDFDVVHAHWVIPNGPIGAAAASRHHLPLVTSLHGSDVAVSERSRAIGRATRWTFGRSDAVTAPSGDLIERARRLGATGLLERLPYGADVDAFAVEPEAAQKMRRRLGLEPGHVVVAGIGRLIPVKGFAYLVDAHAVAVATAPELRLLLVGDGDARAELEWQVDALGVRDSVLFAGTAGRSSIPAYLAAADVVAVPSIRYGGYVDGLPNVALEAMAAGKPLVGSRVGGIPELIREGETGLLVPEKDSAALADAVVALARDPALRSRLGANGLAEIRKERSWNAVGRRLVRVYRAVARHPTT